ncbi:hypothetical protein F1880_000623 [Penicillium rolfsii]|nr:hypothetical protein F1880_000623 [Penicillium rolfsii]
MSGEGKRERDQSGAKKKVVEKKKTLEDWRRRRDDDTRVVWGMYSRGALYDAQDATVGRNLGTQMMEKCRDRAIWLVRFGLPLQKGVFTALWERKEDKL